MKLRAVFCLLMVATLAAATGCANLNRFPHPSPNMHFSDIQPVKPAMDASPVIAAR